MKSNRGAETVAYAIAALAHLAIVIAFAATRRPVSAPASDVSHDEEAVYELTMDPFGEPAPRLSSVTSSTIAPATRVFPSAVAARLAEAIPSDTWGSEAEPAPFTGIGPAAPAPALQLDGPNALFFGGHGEPAPAPRGPTAKERLDVSLKQGLLDQDRARGLGPEGPVLAALTEATYAGVVPTHGTASFHGIVNGEGTLVTLERVASDAAARAWDDVAKAARAALATKKLRMASAPNGVELRIDVSISVKLPNGQDPGLAVNVLGRNVQSGDGPHSTKLSVLDLSALNKLERKLDPRTILTAGVDSVRKSATDDEKKRSVRQPDPQPSSDESAVVLLGGDPDPSNLGAQPRVIVHTRLVDLKPLPN